MRRVIFVAALIGICHHAYGFGVMQWQGPNPNERGNPKSRYPLPSPRVGVCNTSSASSASSTTSLRMAAQKANTKDGDSRVFLVGVGFTQFLLIQKLAEAGIRSVAMTDVQRIDVMRQVWVERTEEAKEMCTLVTNGETEWEEEARKCTSLVICPEFANIPGNTVRALMRQMPMVNRIVVLTPLGTTVTETRKSNEGGFFANLFQAPSQAKQLLNGGENMDYARDVESTVKELMAQQQAALQDVSADCVFIHRGRLNGGGGEDGLGDDFYKLCGSEPEEVLQRCYDQGRLGTQIRVGDVDGSKSSLESTTADLDEETRKLLKELEDKTHRLPLVNAIVSTLTLDKPPERISVTCAVGEVPDSYETIKSTVEQLGQLEQSAAVV